MNVSLTLSDGSLNPQCLYAQPYSLLPIAGRHTVTIPALGVSNPIIFDAPQEGAFEGRTLTITSTSAAMLLLEFKHRNRDIINRSQHCANLFGGQIVPAALPSLGISPFYMQESLWLMPRENIILNIQDLSGAPNVVRVAIHGTLYVLAASDSAKSSLAGVKTYALERNRKSVPFWYAPPPTLGSNAPIVLGAGATVQNGIQISSNAAFHWKKTTSVQTAAYEITWFEPFSGRPLSQAPVHSDLISGSALFPHVWGQGMLLKPSSFLRYTITNLTPNPNTVYITLHGQHLYDLAGVGPEQ